MLSRLRKILQCCISKIPVLENSNRWYVVKHLLWLTGRFHLRFLISLRGIRRLFGWSKNMLFSKRCKLKTVRLCMRAIMTFSPLPGPKDALTANNLFFFCQKAFVFCDVKRLLCEGIMAIIASLSTICF